MTIGTSKQGFGSGNKGFTADPLAFIGQVQANLSGYKEGFPVIRELVQNADDGRAERVLLAVAPGLPDAGHPLLEAPSLVLMNDGRFRDADREAIRRLGLGRKVLDEEAIGKFGLGLKSVFHFCEAFFFGASSVEDTGEQDYLDLLNPWTGMHHARLSAHYDAWNSLAEHHGELMLERLQKLAGDWQRWFFVWLPLRSQGHCPKDPKGNAMHIASVFAGDDESEIQRWWDELGTELSVVFPLLRHLREFRQVRLEGSASTPFEVARLELDPAARRSGFPGILKPRQMGVLQGTLHVSRGSAQNGNSARLPFGGCEQVLDHQEFRTLKDSPHWPQPAIMLMEDDDSVQSPDKNQPHGGAYLTVRQEAPGAGELRLRHTSFLPVGEPFATVPLAIDSQVDLLLHGYYFLPPDRSQVDFGQGGIPPQPVSNAEALKTTWNRLLWHEGVLPLIPQAVARFAQESAWPHAPLSELTGALRRQLDSRLAQVCRDHAWECRLGQGGNGDGAVVSAGQDPTSRWVLVSRPRPEAASYSFPPAGEAVVRETFPRLDRLAEQTAILRPETPRLSSVEPRAWLSRAELQCLLGDEPMELFSHLDKLGRKSKESREQAFNLLVQVLAASLESPDGDGHSWLQEWVAGFLRCALNGLSYGQARPLAPFLQRLARMMAPGSFFAPQYDKGAAEAGYSLVHELNSLGLRVLVLPGLLLDDTQPLESDPLSKEDIRRILQALAGRGESQVVDGMLEQVASCWTGSRRELWLDNSQLQLFPAFEATSGKKSRHSFEQLQASREAARLFRLSGPRPDLETLVSQALPSEGGPAILSLDGPTVRLVYGVEEAVAPCDAASVAELLKKRPNLGTPEARGRLAERLCQDERPEAWASPLRYLAHGFPDHYGAEGPLWLLRPQDSEASWPGVLATLLKSTGDVWRVLDPAVTNGLTPLAQAALGIKAPEEQQVVQALLDHSAQASGEALQSLSREQRDFVFLGVHDDLKLKRLALHETVEGRLVSAEGEAYLDIGYRIPEALSLNGPRILPSSHPEVLVRQRRILTPLDAGAVMMLALRSEEPSRFWEEILDAWHHVRTSEAKHLTSNLLEQVAKKSWLPVRLGPARSPEHIVALQGLDGILKPFLDRFGAGYLSVLEVSDKVIAHPAWVDLCQEMLPKPEVVVEILHLLMGDAEVPALGTLPLKDLDRLGEALAAMPEELMPAAPLLRALLEHATLKEQVPALIEALCRPVPLPRLLELYRWTCARHKDKPKAILKDLATAYLDLASRETGFQQALGGLELLNLEEKWRKASVLCREGGKVHPESVVDEKMQAILDRALEPPPARQVPLAQHTVASTPGTPLLKCLERLFDGQAWDLCMPEVKGGAFAVFAPLDKDLQEQTAHLLGTDWASVTNGLWLSKEPKCFFTPRGHSQRTVEFRLDVEVVEGDRLQVTALDGRTIEVRRAARVSSLLLTPSKQKPIVREDSLHWTLRFLRVDPTGMQQDELHELVWRTLVQVMRLCYHHEKASDTVEGALKKSRTYWEERILQAGQFDLKVAQRLIEQNLPFYFRQLPRRGVGTLARTVELHEQLLRKKAEAEVTTIPDTRHKLLKEVEGSLPVVLDQISRLVSQDGEAQAMLLEMVRTKVGRHFQYSHSSIPFELFQNADDAVVELVDMGGTERVLRSFLVRECPGSLTFGHGGRLINQFRHGDHEFRDRGYHRDLEKMLVMHGSDKEAESGASLVRTGKFGLGFKSVFLASDQVKVCSGRLAFEVVGGMYPVPIAAASAENAREEDTDRFTTRITLLRPKAESEQWSEEILGTFRRWAPLLLVFSRGINKIAWENAEETVNTLAWKPQEVLEAEGLSLGSLGAGSVDGLDRGLLLSGSAGRVLLALGPGGFSPFPADVPRCWVTTPLREALPCRFAFNAHLEVDIGRHQVAGGSETNRMTARQLGVDAGLALCRLFDKVQLQGWPATQEALGLHKSVTPQQFWGQLWEVLSGATSRPIPEGGEPGAAQLVRILEQACLEQLSSHHRVIPTSLWGAFAGTTGLKDIARQVSGLLSREEVFTAAVPLLQHFFEPGQLVHDSVWRILGRVHAKSSREVLKLPELLDRLAPKDELGPDEARLLAPSVSQGLLATFEAELHAEVREIRDSLAQQQFLNQRAHWSRAYSLLCAKSTDADEVHLASFADPEALLSERYQGPAVSLFLEHRGQPRVDNERVATWVLAAPDNVKRLSALRYLLHGRLGRDAAARVYKKIQAGQGAWLAQCLSRDSLQSLGLPPSDIAELQRLLQPPPKDLKPAPPSPNDIPVKDRLKALAAWWNDLRAQDPQGFDLSYEQRVYPWPNPNLSTVADDHASRKDWLVLLSLGAFHTMGRQTAEQSRAFLKKCQRKGWLDLVVTSAENPESLTRVLEGYFAEEDDQEFFRWLGYLPSIYQLSRWIHEYSAMFLEFNKHGSTQTIKDLLNPHHSSYWQGAGLSAPNLRRTLGVGICFVLRELVRKRILRNPEVHPYCFTPLKRVREAVEFVTGAQVGADEHVESSRQIYEALAAHLDEDEVTFGLSFDMPFRYGSEDHLYQILSGGTLL